MNISSENNNPGWGSINRGVLVCDECCGVHRSLGRHVSQVKSLKKGQWSSTQLAMVHQLVSLGANSIWEYSLLDPTQNKHGRRKPNPRDQVHPTKADFIRAKYQFLTFMNKQKDSEVNSLDDLSQQLHSSVRTGNLETSLRLLSIGADPNYFHPEKGTSSLHVAASLNQPLQVELLLVYGADPGAFHAHGHTPADVARKEGYTDIADRLVESQYELTDRLAYYLCGRKPDHRSGQHFLIPAMADSSLDLSELAKAAKKKLQALPNHQFEELARDVYDEVDRREIEHIWMSTSHHTHLVMDRQNVPFLPVNPEFSSTRNQGRQKLARFNAREFATLIIDILTDVRRRQCPSGSDRGTLNLSGKKSISIISDDEPLYDQVASDDDYASIGDTHSLKEVDPAAVNSGTLTHTDTGEVHDRTLENGEMSASLVITTDRQQTDSPGNTQEQGSLGGSSDTLSLSESVSSGGVSDAPITLEEYIEVKRALTESQARIQQVMQTNRDLRQEIVLLQTMVERLVSENQTLRASSSSLDLPPPPPPPASSHPSLAQPAQHHGRGRPMSMFEPREQARSALLTKQPPTPAKKDSASARREAGTSVASVRREAGTSSDSGKLSKHSSGHSSSGSLKSAPVLEQTDSTESDYDNTPDDTVKDARETETDPSSVDAEAQLENARLSGSRSEDAQSSDSLHTLPEEAGEGGEAGAGDGGEAGGAGGEGGLPGQDEVVKKTERITKKIQELLRNAQDGNRDWYVPSADKIFTAVNDMVALFPQTVENEKIELALQQLTTGADRLRQQCCPQAADTPSREDAKLHTQQVIQCAYDIAQAAKQLVMCFE